MPTGQKRAPDPITDGCEPPSGCWELNSGPLEEQAMHLTSEPSLQSEIFFFLSAVDLLGKCSITPTHLGLETEHFNYLGWGSH